MNITELKGYESPKSPLGSSAYLKADNIKTFALPARKAALLPKYYLGVLDYSLRQKGGGNPRIVSCVP